MIDSSCLLPALVVFSLLFGLHARIDVYRAFVCGAKEGLLTLLEMAQMPLRKKAAKPVVCILFARFIVEDRSLFCCCAWKCCFSTCSGAA